MTTARDILFGPGDPALTRRPGWKLVRKGLSKALSAVSSAGQAVVERELATAIDNSLGLDLGQITVGGWRKHSALRAAAELTRTDLTRTETVTLATHQITMAQHPYLEIVVSGVRLATVHCDVGVRLDVDGVVAVVSGARLVALRGGRLTASVTLGCEGHELASRRVGGLDPILTVPLGDGVALLGEDLGVERRS